MINLELGNSRILVDSSLPGNESPPWSEERPTPALSTFQIIYLSKDSQSSGPRNIVTPLLTPVDKKLSDNLIPNYDKW